MSKKSVLLTISIWDDHVRLSLIGKTMKALDHVSFRFTLTVNDIGIRQMDSFELVYFIRTGIQQLLSRQSVMISSIGVSIMPGYIMAWDRDSCTPLTPCLVPNNSLPPHQYQEFKFSSFFSLLKDADQQSVNPNCALNLWVLSKRLKKPFAKGLMISGLDTWLNYLMSGYSDDSLIASPDIMSELTFSDNDWDDPLLQSVGFNKELFPGLGDCQELVTKNFSPLEDGIPIAYSTSTNRLISNMLRQYTNEPIACIHLSDINHMYIDNMSIQSSGSQNHWVRFSSWNSLYHSFNLTNGTPSTVDVTVDDIKDDIVVPLDPFRSYHNQTYHMLNMASFEPQNIRKLGVLQTLFLIKYLLSQYDHRSQSGHIQKLVISMSEWQPSVVQLCVDLCQIHGIDFNIAHWLDLIHVCQFSGMNVFFSQSTKQDLFKLNEQLIPTLDPLTCYSLYQEWEHWFNTLYDYWR
ncbi:hypothetical protein DID73_00160 [Candidatus Marinamargulisbacteria bacterium SCGC AG-343-K17]|nr:hypothetical protein DID73_00160 [Candidatus Marinamargulisbacteria bacterium SCGC AG-343-K17]